MILGEILTTSLGTAIIGAAALAVAGLFFWNLKRRRAATGVSKPRKVQSFLVNLPPDTLIQRLRDAIEETDYQIEESVQTDGDLLLSERATATSWGFYYPVYLTPVEKHQTRVEIGIKSMAFQMGPIVRKHHRKCVEAMRALLTL